MTIGRVLPQSRLAKGTMLFLVVLAGLNALSFAVGSLGGSPRGPRSSSFSTSPQGLSAYAELLEVNGYETGPSREPVGSAELPPTSTVFVLDPQAIAREDTAALRRFVASGGRLVAGGADPGWISGVIDRPPRWDPVPVERARPLVPAPEVAGVGTIVADGSGSWSDVGTALPLAGDDDGIIAVLAGSDRGRVVLLADTTPIQNRLLATADNAAFGIALAGPVERPVVFVESVHGYGPATGLAALPARWRSAGLILGLAAMTLIAAKIRRFGFPETGERDLPPPRRSYVDALSATLARTRDRDEAAAPLRAEALRRLRSRTGADPEANRDEIIRGAVSVGIPATEVETLFRPTGSDQDLLLTGRCVARLFDNKGVSR